MEENPSPFHIPTENRWWLVVAVVIAVNVLISYGITVYFSNRIDGMDRLGWAAQSIPMNGKDRVVYMPFFIKGPDYRDLKEGK